MNDAYAQQIAKALQQISLDLKQLGIKLDALTAAAAARK
jgi:hypothetical protein